MAAVTICSDFGVRWRQQNCLVLWKGKRCSSFGFCTWFHCGMFLHQQATLEILAGCPMCVHASLQLCPALCDPVDRSLLGSSVHRILQARILEWVSIQFRLHDTEIHQIPQEKCSVSWDFHLRGWSQAQVVTCVSDGPAVEQRFKWCPSLGSVNFLEWLLELRETFNFLDYHFIT